MFGRHLPSVPQAGCHRVAQGGTQRFCWGARCRGSTAMALPPTSLNKLFSFSSSSSPPFVGRRVGGCQTDRTTKLLRRVKVPRRARRVGIKKGRGGKKESRPPPAQSSRTHPIPLLSRASPPSAPKPPPNIAPPVAGPYKSKPIEAAMALFDDTSSFNALHAD